MRMKTNAELAQGSLSSRDSRTKDAHENERGAGPVRYPAGTHGLKVLDAEVNGNRPVCACHTCES